MKDIPGRDKSMDKGGEDKKGMISWEKGSLCRSNRPLPSSLPPDKVQDR